MQVRLLLGLRGHLVRRARPTASRREGAVQPHADRLV